MKFSQGHWTCLGPGSGEKCHGSSSDAQKKEEWDPTANKTVQRFKETGHPVFRSISALSRGILNREEEAPHDDYTVPRKAPYVTSWKRNQDAVHWVRLQRPQDQGLEFWQTKSCAIMTYTTIPGVCIDRVTTQNGERVIFERLETPRLAPKVTLRKNWQNQQQQWPSSDTDVPSLWKQWLKREDQAGVQDVSNHSTDVDLASGNCGSFNSNMKVDTHLGDKEVNTNAFLENEVVEEELTDAKTKVIQNGFK